MRYLYLTIVILFVLLSTAVEGKRAGKRKGGRKGKKPQKKGKVVKKGGRTPNRLGRKRVSEPSDETSEETPIVKAPQIDLPPSGGSDVEDDDATCIVQCKRE